MTNRSATQRDRAQCSLRAGLGHRWRDCRFRNRLFPVFPVNPPPSSDCVPWLLLEAVISVHITVAMEVTMSQQLRDKIANPEGHFDKPKDVVQDDTLSHEEKKKALNTWEQNEQQLLTASNEGMPGSDEGQRKKESNSLGEVVQAKDQIGEKPKHKPSH